MLTYQLFGYYLGNVQLKSIIIFDHEACPRRSLECQFNKNIYDPSPLLYPSALMHPSVLLPPSALLLSSVTYETPFGLSEKLISFQLSLRRIDLIIIFLYLCLVDKKEPSGGGK